MIQELKKYIIRYSIEAKDDMINIKKYIKYDLQEPSIANRLIDRIKEKIENLTHDPEIYAIIDDSHLKSLEIRKLIIDNYIVFYRIKDANIEIVRILYGRRNWINLI